MFMEILYWIFEQNANYCLRYVCLQIGCGSPNVAWPGLGHDISRPSIGSTPAHIDSPFSSIYMAVDLNCKMAVQPALKQVARLAGGHGRLREIDIFASNSLLSRSSFVGGYGHAGNDRLACIGLSALTFSSYSCATYSLDFLPPFALNDILGYTRSATACGSGVAVFAFIPNLKDWVFSLTFL